MYIKQKGTVVTQLMITQKTVEKHSGRHVCVFAVATQTSQCETVRELKKIAIQYANNSNFFTQAHKDEIILLWIEQTITVIEIR